MGSIIEKRSEEFSEKGESFDLHVFRDLVVATGDWLENLVSPEITDAAMKVLYRALVAENRGPDNDEAVETLGWRELWKTNLDYHDMICFYAVKSLNSLNGYAFWGLPTTKVYWVMSVAEREEEIDRTISAMRTLLVTAPPGWADLTAAESIVSAAEARFHLDHGEAVTPEQLAALARVSLKSVKNLLTPSSGSGVGLDADGRIPAAAALAWLNGRDGFLSSVWHEELNADATEAPPPDPEDLGEVVFVPQARDGSWFDPATCRRAGGYTIGPKGAERAVGDYREALRQLARMPTPHWRRPNGVGNWGIVAGLPQWLRKPAADLGLE